MSLALFDDAYWALKRTQIRTGRLAPVLEAKLLAYAYGEPKQTVDIPQLRDMAAALARKVVDEFHPGPTKGPSVAMAVLTVLDAGSDARTIEATEHLETDERHTGS